MINLNKVFKQVVDVHFNTRKYGGLSYPGLEPLKKTQLDYIQRKDPNSIDNYSHVCIFLQFISIILQRNVIVY